MKKDIIMPAVALLIICLVSSALLAATNAITKGKIEESALKKAQESRQVVFASADSFGEEQSVTVGENEITYTSALDEGGNVLGYVFTASNKGYGGDVQVMTAIDNSGTVLKSVILAMDDETPGLGQNASKPDFLNQFSGKSGKVEWVKSGATGNQINGVTSASYTSKAVIACVNESVDAFNTLTANGEGEAK